MIRARKIIWEYWQHPLGSQDEWVSEEKARPTAVMGYEPGDYADDDEGGDGFDHPEKVRPILPTSSGFVPVRIYADTPKAFDFWIGHTNFDVTNRVASRIKRFEGVETLDVLTRYRFRVGFGKAFGREGLSTTLRRGIARVLAADPERRDGRPEVMWAALVLPDGKIDSCGTKDHAEFEDRVGVYQRTRDAVGGEIYYDL